MVHGNWELQRSWQRGALLVVSDGVLRPATSMAVIIFIESLAAVMYQNHIRGLLYLRVFFFFGGGS